MKTLDEMMADLPEDRRQAIEERAATIRKGLVPSPFPELSEFEFWLGTVDPNATIAKDWDATSCPLCAFLKSCGFESPVVFGLGRGWVNGDRNTAFEQRRPLPSWAQEFTYWVDKVKPREVSAEDCLFILNQRLFNAKRWEK